MIPSQIKGAMHNFLHEFSLQLLPRLNMTPKQSRGASISLAAIKRTLSNAGMLSANSLHAERNVSSLHGQTYSMFTTSWPTGTRQNMRKSRFAQGPACIYGVNNRSINLSAQEQHPINYYCLCHLKSFFFFFKISF